MEITIMILAVIVAIQVGLVTALIAWQIWNMIYIDRYIKRKIRKELEKEKGELLNIYSLEQYSFLQSQLVSNLNIRNWLAIIQISINMIDVLLRLNNPNKRVDGFIVHIENLLENKDLMSRMEVDSLKELGGELKKLGVITDKVFDLCIKIKEMQ